MKKRILIHSLVFSPDGVSTAYLYNDIALGLQDAGYEVVVLSTTPHYNRVENELQKQPLQKRLLGIYSISRFNGIKVYHVYQKKYKQFYKRAIGFVFWHAMSFLIGLFQKNISLILCPSPPLTIGLVSIMLAKLKNAKVVYNVQEIYPDLLINQGSLRSPLLLNLLRKLEQFVYNHCDRTVTIDRVFYETIAERFKDRTKLVIIPNFVDTDLYKPIEDVEGRIDGVLFPPVASLKVMYAGNIGHAQDWAPLLAVAEKMTGKPVEFWIVGEGALKETLQTEINERKLSNIHLLPYQPREKMPLIVNYADIHFIFMDPKTAGQGFPSKVYTIMACRKPLLVITGENTPLYNFLHGKKSAFLISGTNTENNYEALADTLDTIVSDRQILNQLGEQAITEINNSYSKSAVIEQYVSLCNELLNKNQHAQG